jgi:hypothetical protein
MPEIVKMKIFDPKIATCARTASARGNLLAR